VADPASSAELKEAAARRLAVLAAAEAHGHPLVPQAHPATWWGIRAATRSELPIRPAGEPVTLTASALDTLLTCPAKWFLEREAAGEELATQSQGFGNVVHALADRIAKGELAGTDDLMPYVDQVWGQMTFRTPWSSAKERAEVEAALQRFVTWHNRPGARTVVGTEESLTAEVTLPDGQRVVLRGYADRIELDEDGRVVVVDLKTGKYPFTKQQVAEHAQLGVYQLAVEAGAADHLLGEHGPGRSGGAELWQLRIDRAGAPLVQAQAPQPADEHGVTQVEQQLMEAAEIVRSERLVARGGDHCRNCSFHALCPVQGAGTVLS
jgi:RecB family exonuclease